MEKLSRWSSLSHEAELPSMKRCGKDVRFFRNSSSRERHRPFLLKSLVDKYLRKLGTWSEVGSSRPASRRDAPWPCGAATRNGFEPHASLLPIRQSAQRQTVVADGRRMVGGQVGQDQHGPGSAVVLAARFSVAPALAGCRLVRDVAGRECPDGSAGRRICRNIVRFCGF